MAVSKTIGRVAGYGFASCQLLLLCACGSLMCVVCVVGMTYSSRSVDIGACPRFALLYVVQVQPATLPRS
jgi:hypothetical protein